MRGPLDPVRRLFSVLVVEDNPGDAHLIREAFRECGDQCHLEFAETTTEARQILAQQRFDLMLSDMGVRNGETAEFIRSIRENNRLRTMPVIVLSGSPDPRPAYLAGANAFISKTMDMDEFFAKINALVHFWIHVAELPPAE